MARKPKVLDESDGGVDDADIGADEETDADELDETELDVDDLDDVVDDVEAEVVETMTMPTSRTMTMTMTMPTTKLMRPSRNSRRRNSSSWRKRQPIRCWSTRRRS